MPARACTAEPLSPRSDTSAGDASTGSDLESCLRAQGDVADAISPTTPRSPRAAAALGRTLTLYDWDDTFLPSTYLASLGLRVDDTDALPQPLADELSALETTVIAILKEASRHGLVKVITNAEEGWIELSGARFMPRLSAYLAAARVPLVSARTAYEAAYPDSPSSWKIAAFAAEVDTSFPDSPELNVLVLGDSLSERDAAHALASRLPASCVKSVKLVERPTIAQLHRQITLLYSSFGDLRNHYGSFDVNLQC